MASPNCPGCEQLRQHLVKHGLGDKYRFIDVSTKEGSRIADELGITYVPNCIVVEQSPEGRKARACTPDEFMNIIEGK